MGNIFSGSEVVELGIQIEKNGRDFYNALSSRSKNLPVIEALKFLAKEEDKHIRVFRNILKKTKEYPLKQIYADEYFAYMNALAAGYVFTEKNKGRAIARKITGDKEAVELAIGFEKDSIIFYEGMKKIVPQYNQAIVDELIRQEEKHLRKLTDLTKGRLPVLYTGKSSS